MRALAGIVGDTCGGADVLIEVIPPRGVELAVSRRHPIYWGYPERGDIATSNGRDQLRIRNGRFGGRAFEVLSDGQLDGIPLADDSGPAAIHVPLVARRALKGTAARAPRCRAKGEGEPPCTRRAARDHVQVAVEVGASVTPTLLVAEAGPVRQAEAAVALVSPGR